MGFPARPRAQRASSDNECHRPIAQPFMLGIAPTIAAVLLLLRGVRKAFRATQVAGVETTG